MTPYGKKNLIYTDWTASGRLYRPIEEKLMDTFGPFVANTHTETSITGTAMTMAYHEARHIIKHHVNATDNDVLITDGTGMTGVVNKLQRILGLRIPENLKEYNTFVDDLKFKAREKSYSIFDQKYYTNVSKGIVADNVQLMTKDNFILAEYANRLTHINNSMKNVLLPSIDKHYKRAVELLSILKKEYKLKEDTDVDVSNF